MRADAWAKEAVRMALVNLSAVAAPAGCCRWCWAPAGLASCCMKRSAMGWKAISTGVAPRSLAAIWGSLVPSELCTVVDDGTMLDRRGSVAIDDEGTPGQYNVLIENGVLKGYMQDKLNARLMGVAPTGNGRRESYAHLPMPRMTNTLYAAGPVDAAGDYRIGRLRYLCA